MERYEDKDIKEINWTKYKVIVPTEKDRKSLMEAFEHIHYSDVDSDFVPVNQLIHEYLDEDVAEGAKNNIIVNKEMYEQLQISHQNKTFKIVSRNPKTGRQFKKRVYTSEEDYLKYKDDLIKRYSYNYDVEVYEMISGGWKLIDKIEKQ